MISEWNSILGLGYVRSHCTSRIGATEMDYFTKFNITHLAHWWQTNFGAPFVGMFFLTTKRQPKPGNNRWRGTETGGRSSNVAHLPGESSVHKEFSDSRLCFQLQRAGDFQRWPSTSNPFSTFINQELSSNH